MELLTDDNAAGADETDLLFQSHTGTGIFPRVWRWTRPLRLTVAAAGAATLPRTLGHNGTQ